MQQSTTLRYLGISPDLEKRVREIQEKEEIEIENSVSTGVKQE